MGEYGEFLSIKTPCEEVVSTKEIVSPKNGWKWPCNIASKYKGISKSLRKGIRNC